MGYMIEPTGLFEAARRKRLQREAIIAAAASPAVTLPVTHAPEQARDSTIDSALGVAAGDLGMGPLDRRPGTFLRRTGNRLGRAGDGAGRA